MTSGHNEVLVELSPEDRLLCLRDELVFGVFYVEDTQDGYERLDPLEVTRNYE